MIFYLKNELFVYLYGKSFKMKVFLVFPKI